MSDHSWKLERNSGIKPIALANVAKEFLFMPQVLRTYDWPHDQIREEFLLDSLLIIYIGFYQTRTGIRHQY